MRILFLLAAFVLLATFAPPALQHREPPPPVTFVRFAPVPLDAQDPAAKRLGRLAFLGAWALTSNDARVGGISALHVEAGEALALSDAGWRIRLPLPRGPTAGAAAGRDDRAGAGAAGRQVQPRHRIARRPRRRGLDRLRAVQCGLALRRAGASPGVPPPRRRPCASGATMPVRKRWCGCADGRFLVFAEGEGGDSEALLFAGDPAAPGTPALRLRYRPPEGYRITDAALLPDGRLASAQPRRQPVRRLHRQADRRRLCPARPKAR